MIKFDNSMFGKKVVFNSPEQHELEPDFYPPAGTIGIIIPPNENFEEANFLVEWPNGSTSWDDKWECNEKYLDLYEDSEYTKQYRKGYVQALNDLNTYKKVIQEKWEPSICPNCHEDFREFEPVNDGYYSRATNFRRCPYCGQAIYWDDQQLEFMKKYYPNDFKTYTVEDIFKKREKYDYL